MRRVIASSLLLKGPHFSIISVSSLDGGSLETILQFPVDNLTIYQDCSSFICSKIFAIKYKIRPDPQSLSDALEREVFSRVGFYIYRTYAKVTKLRHYSLCDVIFLNAGIPSLQVVTVAMTILESVSPDLKILTDEGVLNFYLVKNI